MTITTDEQRTNGAGPAVAEAGPEDWALGPGAVLWKVMHDPSVFIVGILREAILLTQHLPFAAAAFDHDRVHEDPVLRFGTVARYIYSATYGTATDAERVSSFVRRNHDRVKGVEPVSGEPYRAASDYELVLTHVMLFRSYLDVYEELHGRLTDTERDQYFVEAQVAGPRLGIRPDHLPSSYREVEEFMVGARKRFAVGAQGRWVLRPFDSGVYPEGSVIAGLPPVRRWAVALLVKGLVDMALYTMHPDDRDVIAINRRPLLRSRPVVRLSLRALSAWLRSRRGRAAFDRLLKPDVARIFRRALEAEAAAGGNGLAGPLFKPDPRRFPVAELEGHVRNMPTPGGRR